MLKLFVLWRFISAAARLFIMWFWHTFDKWHELDSKYLRMH